MTPPAGDEQTIVCVLTPTGRGAVAVVAVAGTGAVRAVDQCFVAKNGHPLDRQPLGRIVYGHWQSEVGEDLVVCRRSDALVEVNCHGGAQSVATVVGQLVEAGCREISWQEWVKRSQACPIQAAAQIALADAATARTATILLDQFHGALRREVEAIRSALLNNQLKDATSHLEALIAWVPCGLHLTEPWQVVIAGRPNVGKSSLINALVGYRRAIVFDQPGTTRDVVSSTTVIDGWPVRLSDTAGLHVTTDALESAGIEQARALLAESDLVVWVEDATTTDPNFLTERTELLHQRATELNLVLPPRQLVVLNKIDLATHAATDSTLATSALTGQGIEQLLAAISLQCVPTAPEAGAAVPFTTRQAELLQAAGESVNQDNGEQALELLETLLKH